MLKINNLHASAGDHEILRGINLAVNGGEVHAAKFTPSWVRMARERARSPTFFPAASLTR